MTKKQFIKFMSASKIIYDSLPKTTVNDFLFIRICKSIGIIFENSEDSTTESILSHYIFENKWGTLKKNNTIDLYLIFGISKTYKLKTFEDVYNVIKNYRKDYDEVINKTFRVIPYKN